MGDEARHASGMQPESVIVSVWSQDLRSADLSQKRCPGVHEDCDERAGASAGCGCAWAGWDGAQHSPTGLAAWMALRPISDPSFMLWEKKQPFFAVGILTSQSSEEGGMVELS